MIDGSTNDQYGLVGSDRLQTLFTFCFGERFSFLVCSAVCATVVSACFVPFLLLLLFGVLLLLSRFR
jgi:hypothetical protein